MAQKPTILVATWGEGLFAITVGGRTQEISKERVRGLAPDGHGGALAIVGQHSLRRRASSGEWSTIAKSEFELSCCFLKSDQANDREPGKASGSRSFSHKGSFRKEFCAEERAEISAAYAVS